MPTDRKPGFDAVFEIGVDWKPIAPQARLVWTLTAVAIAGPFLLAGTVVLSLAAHLAGLLAGLVVAVLTLVLLRWLVARRYLSWGYSVHEEVLLLRRGFLIRRLTIVPIGRMQFVDIQQGPLDRWLGVANLQLHTAAAATDAKVPLLSLDGAGRLRDQLIERGAGRSGGT